MAEIIMYACKFTTRDHVLNSGIRRQLDAFRSGFNTVFPMDKLGSFSPEEVSGSQI